MTIAKREAFLKGIESGSFENMKFKIYVLLLQQPKTLEMLIKYGFPEKTASARISDLMDLGLVEAIGTPKSVFHVVTDPIRQNVLMKQREQLAFEKWYKKGITMEWLSHKGPFQSTIIFPD